MRRRISSVSLMALALPVAVQAQVVRGFVAEAGSGDPVAAAMITVMDTTGRFIAGTWSDDVGSFTIRLGAPGTFIMRVERIGFESHHTRTLLPGDDVLRILLPADAIRLDGVVVGAARQCRIAEEEGSLLAQVWDEARKNLRASLRPGRTARLHIDARRTDRLLSLQTLEVERLRDESRGASLRSPFMAQPASDLVQYGYVRRHSDGSADYYAPSAETLLDPSFEQTHCFGLAQGTPEEIGLAFEPHDTRTLPDIEGVMWFERATARLKRIEYAYTDHVLPLGVPDDVFGGETHFRHMENGDVVVDRWWIRMPEFQRPLRLSELPADVTERTGLVRVTNYGLAQLARAGLMVREAGGEIVSARVLRRGRNR